MPYSVLKEFAEPVTPVARHHDVSLLTYKS